MRMKSKYVWHKIKDIDVETRGYVKIAQLATQQV